MDNASVDTQVLAAITAGRNTCAKIHAFVNANRSEVDLIDVRAVDKSLQRLRRANKIKYTGQSPKDGWRVQTQVIT